MCAHVVRVKEREGRRAFAVFFHEWNPGDVILAVTPYYLLQYRYVKKV